MLAIMKFLLPCPINFIISYFDSLFENLLGSERPRLFLRPFLIRAHPVSRICGSTWRPSVRLVRLLSFVLHVCTYILSSTLTACVRLVSSLVILQATSNSAQPAETHNTSQNTQHTIIHSSSNPHHKQKALIAS